MRTPILFVSCLLKYKILGIFLSDFVATEKTTLNNEELLLNDIHNTMFATVNAIISKESHNDHCDIVLIYDELLTIPINLSNMWNRFKHYETPEHPPPLLLTLNLSNHSANNSDPTRFDSSARRLADYLHSLYRIGNCYIFMVWITDPRILYPTTINIHPGWRNQDYVILTFHHLMRKSQEMIKYRFWKEIPNIVGLKRRSDFRSLINIFTVLPYYNKNGSVRTFEIDFWHVKEQSFQKNAVLFWDKFTTLNGSPLHVGVSYKEPFFIWGDKENPYWDGLDARLLNLVKRQLNFTLKWKVINATGSRSGNDGKNTSWTGLMGEIEEGKVDFGCGGISVSPSRLKDFGFCSSYWTDSYTFISPLNKTEQKTMNGLIHPLSSNVWIAIGISGIVATISMKIFANHQMNTLELESLKQPESKPKDVWFTSVFNNLHVLWALLLQKSFSNVPKSNSVRCVFITMSFAFLIIGIEFGVELYGRLLEKKEDISVDEVRLIWKSGLKWYTRNYDGHLNDFINTTERKGLVNLWNKVNFIQTNESFQTINEVVLGHGIFIDSRAKLTFLGGYNYLGLNGFKFHLSSDHILRVNIGWPTRQNWPLKQKIDDVIKRMVESGIVQYWMSHFMHGKIGWDDEAWKIPIDLQTSRDKATKNVDPSLLDKVEHRLKFEHLAGVLIIWALGLILATAVFVCELVTCFTITTTKMVTIFWKFMTNWIKSKMLTVTRNRNEVKRKFAKNVRLFKKRQQHLRVQQMLAKKIFVKPILKVPQEIIW